jgi:hypothetical protein
VALQDCPGVYLICRPWRCCFYSSGQGRKNYLNNGLDFFKKLVSVHVLQMARSGLTGWFHSGESSICQSGTLQYETKKNY